MYILIGGNGILGTYIAEAVQMKTEEDIVIVARTEREGGGKHKILPV